MMTLAPPVPVSLMLPEHEADPGVVDDSRFRELLQQLSLQHAAEVAQLRSQVVQLKTQLWNGGHATAELDEDASQEFSESKASEDDMVYIDFQSDEPVVDVKVASIEDEEWDRDISCSSAGEEVPPPHTRPESKKQTPDSPPQPLDDQAKANASDRSLTVTAEALAEQQQEQMRAFKSMLVEKRDYFEGEDFISRFGNFLLGDFYETSITLLVLLNLLFMAAELQVLGMTSGFQIGYPGIDEMMSSQTTDMAFHVTNLVFNIVFLLDVMVRVVVLGKRFWKRLTNWMDAGVVAISIMEIAFLDLINISPGLIRMLRLGKILRATRFVTHSTVLDSLNLLLKCIKASVAMLFWSIFLLLAIQFVFSMIIGYLLRGFIDDPNNEMESRRRVFQYYGTYTRTVLTMFECLFANWGPPARILTELVTEWFVMFWLLYRCLIGFAVLNVVNAVFVQQTMRVAHADEELAFKRKLEEQQGYTQKLFQLFHRLDESGDGEITWDEFSQMLTSPQLKFWMSELEFEPHDLVGLFGLLDDGDERISIDEFMDGVVRLKGSARNVDVAQLLVLVRRLEKKMDVLATDHKISRRRVKQNTIMKKHVKASLELATASQ